MKSVPLRWKFPLSGWISIGNEYLFPRKCSPWTRFPLKECSPYRGLTVHVSQLWQRIWLDRSTFEEACNTSCCFGLCWILVATDCTCTNWTGNSGYTNFWVHLFNHSISYSLFSNRLLQGKFTSLLWSLFQRVSQWCQILMYNYQSLCNI